MDYLDRIARSKEQVARDLAAFVTESAAGPALNDLPLNGLSQFLPEDQSGRAPAAPIEPEGRKLPIPALLTAAMIAAAVSAAWWGGFFPGKGSMPHDVPAQPSAQAAIAPRGRADVPGTPPVEIAPTVEVRPSSRAPIASVRPSVALSEMSRASTAPPNPVALSGNAGERRVALDRTVLNPLDRAFSSTRGTSGAERPLSIRRPAATPPIEAPRTAPTVAENTAVRSPAPEPAVAVPTPAPAPPPPISTAAPARPAAAALPSVVAKSEQSEIQRALGQYRTAYGLLDANAARAVWPSVDVRALARAFDGLTSQQLAFESCQFDIAGEAATAQCRGSATYTPKVGNRDPKLERREWTFHLRKVDDAWKIQSAQTRR